MMENNNTYKLIIQSPSTWKLNRDGKSESIKKVYGLVFEKVTKLVATGSFPLEIPKIVLDSEDADHHIVAVWFFDDYISVSSLKSSILNEVKNNNSVLDSPLVINILKKSIGTIYIPATSLCQSIKLVKKTASTNIPENLTTIFPRHSILKFRIAIEPNYFPLSSIDNLENYFKDSVQKKRIGVNRAGFHFFDVDDVVDTVSNVPSMYSHCPSEKNFTSKHQLLDDEDEDSLYNKIESCFSKSPIRKSKSYGGRSFPKSYVPGMYSNMNSNDTFYPTSNNASYDKAKSFDNSAFDDTSFNIEKYKKSDNSPKFSKSTYDIDSAIRDFKKQNKLAQNQGRYYEKMDSDYRKEYKPLSYESHIEKVDYPLSNPTNLPKNNYTSEMPKKTVSYDEYVELNNKYKGLLGRFMYTAFRLSKQKTTAHDLVDKNQRDVIAKSRHLTEYLTTRHKLNASRAASRKLARSLLIQRAKTAKISTTKLTEIQSSLNERIKQLERENGDLKRQNKELKTNITNAEEEHQAQLSEITMQIEKTTEDFYLQKTIIQELQKRLNNDTKGEEIKALKANEVELKNQIKALTIKNVELTDENTLLECKLKHSETLKTSEIENKLTKITDFISKRMQTNTYHLVKDRISDSYKRYSMYSNSLKGMISPKEKEAINDTKLLADQSLSKLGDEQLKSYVNMLSSNLMPNHMNQHTKMAQTHTNISHIKSMPSSLIPQSHQIYNVVNNMHRFGALYK